MFLTTVFVILLSSVFAVSWVSVRYVFGRLEPAFIGALVAASGTIFAGCIAYTAASENVRIANEARIDAVNERNALSAKVAKDAQDTKAAELQAVEGLKQTVDRLIHQFDGAEDTGAKDYFQHMFDAEQNGAITPRLRKGVPYDLSVRAIDIFDHIFGLRNSVMRLVEARSANPPPVFEENRTEANAAIKKSLDELNRFSDDLVPEIKLRTQ